MLLWLLETYKFEWYVMFILALKCTKTWDKGNLFSPYWVWYIVTLAYICAKARAAAAAGPIMLTKLPSDYGNELIHYNMIWH